MEAASLPPPTQLTKEAFLLLREWRAKPGGERKKPRARPDEGGGDGGDGGDGDGGGGGGGESGRKVNELCKGGGGFPILLQYIGYRYYC